jgi:chemotaxis protein MotB
MTQHITLQGFGARAPKIWTILAPLVASAAFSSCVTQRQYDDAVELARYNQTSLHEKEKYASELQAENERLKRQLAQNDVNALSAGYSGDLDTRLSELQSKVDNLGHEPGDIERFDVEGGYVLMVQDKILFESGSDALTAEGREALIKISGDINAKPHGRIWVRGHTDSDPVAKPATKEKFPHGNLELSAMRAVNVGAELTTSGKVNARDVVVAGFGQYDPLKDNSNAQNKRLNRRVEIFVADQKGAAAAPASSKAAEKPTAKK